MLTSLSLNYSGHCACHQVDESNRIWRNRPPQAAAVAAHQASKERWLIVTTDNQQLTNHKIKRVRKNSAASPPSIPATMHTSNSTKTESLPPSGGLGSAV